VNIEYQICNLLYPNSVNNEELFVGDKQKNAAETASVAYK